MADVNYRDRTDTVAKKLQLLQEAYATGRLDLAMSLADSLRETVRFEKQLRSAPAPMLGADVFGRVSELPKPWSEWARGWQYYKAFQLFETVGVRRTGEPFEFTIAVEADQASDLYREVRVARISGNGALVEIPSQISDETCTAKSRQCKVLIAAEIPEHGNATFLLFVGNPNAERPDYLSDLKLTGEGFNVEIGNEHYLAKMSQQSGQLERLTFGRQHGLELYAGGKGHGEPPGIDWGHDYVDAEHFQKHRMRNWDACPDFEVEQGPICVRLRRWGFPRSPLHPVFTPSRVHMDVEYRFYAGLPYFVKQSQFDVIQDVAVAAMRDDEWVFSGYSFTDELWLDKNGKLHEGTVPPSDYDHLWGVGFFNKTSRDFFIALRLEHSAQNVAKLPHNGAPNLHYDGHGQLWSRYPVVDNITLKQGASFRQKNAYLLGGYPPQNAAMEIEGLRHGLLNPLVLQPADVKMPAQARAAGTLARPGELDDATVSKASIWKALREIKDEQFYTADANVVDMGYVYDVRVRAGTIHVIVTMPHKGRPRYDFLVSQGGGRISDGIRERLRKLDGVRNVVVELSWNPSWAFHRMNAAGLAAMGISKLREKT